MLKKIPFYFNLLKDFFNSERMMIFLKYLSIEEILFQYRSVVNYIYRLSNITPTLH